jgi:hypothetical protein
MNSFLSTLLGWVGLTPPRIFCRRKVWEAGVHELARRTLGEKRESGAYLLGKTLTNGARTIFSISFSTMMSIPRRWRPASSRSARLRCPASGKSAASAVTGSSPTYMFIRSDTVRAHPTVPIL